MLRYVNTDVVFQEIPDEVSLAINISGCPCHCPGCHSPYLWRDIGMPLDCAAVDRLLSTCSDDITCIAFMGGDGDPAAVSLLAEYVRQKDSTLKTAWYTGRTIISPLIARGNFDYIKVGPYIAHLGPLTARSTNQRLYRVDRATLALTDLTYRFWKK